MKLPAIIIITFICGIVNAQTLTQTIRGSILDKETSYPLTGAQVVLISDTSQLRGSVSDINGEFKLENVPVGRQSFKITYIGYEDVILNNVVVSSAKEVILNIQMQESSMQLKGVVVKDTRDGDASNEMALVSSRSFTIEETERYAGSRGDPARMASNFAGVQGADDSRNDIVIRGNSPQAVLWRMEGIDIPNPNHFNIPGTAGGPVSMINNKILGNSDFYTGAFPAEFGNSIAGVFDLNLRNGNNENHEFSWQFGFLGTEFFAEGPLSSKNRSSFLLSYRYSTLAIFNGLGIDIGTTAIPKYQDLAFNMNFPLKNKGSVSFFGLAGNSSIDILISDQITPDRNIYGENDRDQYFKSAAGTMGMSYKKPVSASTYYSITGAVSGDLVDAYHELVFRTLNSANEYEVDSLQPMLDYTFKNTKASVSLFSAHKFSSANTVNAGINSDLYIFNFQDSVRNITEGSEGYNTWRHRWDTDDEGLLIQPFVQWKHDFSDNTEATFGLHSQYFSLTESFVPVEPRAAIKHHINQRSTVEFGAGLHSQIQPTYMYFQSRNTEGAPLPGNLNVGFTRSLQIVGGYQYMLSENIRMKSEVYFQHLFDIPVEKNASSFSMINSGAGFARIFPDTLVNEGIGRNYGIELTLEKFFSRGYLFLVTGSLFEAKYQGSDNIWRDTDFNGNYIFNALFTKEWSISKHSALALGGKITTAGGRRYGPVDEQQSEQQKEVVFQDDKRNSLQFDPYFRTDLKVNYRLNRRKFTHEIGLDLVNILDTKNVLKLTYAPNDMEPSVSPVRREYQLGFLPIFYYRVDF